jgi:AraC-like DNA-binding protein
LLAGHLFDHFSFVYFCAVQVAIKNMVCNRCIVAVKALLDDLGLAYASVQLGEVTLQKEPSEAQLRLLKEGLSALGFELLDDSKRKLIEKIKTIIIEQVHYSGENEQYNLSHLLSSKLHKDYSYLSHLFSEVEGTTIEKFGIRQKIEKAKELLVYNELPLSEIAFQLGYSSVAHLSAQFKKVTGLTPTHFKNMGGIHRKALDNI